MADNDTSYIPEGDHALKPYICVRGAAEAIDFYVSVFGATESPEHRFVDADGKIGHAELRFADSAMYLADEYPGYGISPIDLPDSPCALYLHVPDTDAVAAAAEAAGATILEAPHDTFYGARRATLRDPFGHRWMRVTPGVQGVGTLPKSVQKRTVLRRFCTDFGRSPADAVSYVGESQRTASGGNVRTAEWGWPCQGVGSDWTSGWATPLPPHLSSSVFRTSRHTPALGRPTL